MTEKKLNEAILKVSTSRDTLAFQLIFDYFAPRIIGYLVGTGTNSDIAEEIAQEVLTIVWQKSHLFKPESSKLKTWIFTIARNKRIDRIRKDKNQNYNEYDLIQNLYINTDEDSKVEDKINEMQSNLSEKEKNLIKMNFFESKSHKIIAQELEIPLGTVKSRIRSILNKMEMFKIL